MNPRYRLYRRRRGVFYLFDRVTGKRESLDTRDAREAARLLHAKNEATANPQINRQIARAYLAVADPLINQRTWQTVMGEIIKLKKDENQQRWIRAAQDKAFDLIRNVVVMETRPEHFLRVLETGTVSTNVFLRRLHNFALDMTWLPWPVIPKKQWPPVRFQVKRAITADEHSLILAYERNPETNAFYQLCWHLGGSQSDIANLSAEDIDWEHQAISYHRRKTNQVAILHFGDQVRDLLCSLPREGLLFPRMARTHEKHRAQDFRRRCDGLGIKGVTLHSYRYAWAERAKSAGYPERFAMAALGHNSQAVHRAYAKNAQMVLPSLESFEKNGRKRKVSSRPRSVAKPEPVIAAQSNRAFRMKILPFAAPIETGPAAAQDPAPTKTATPLLT
ncbi:MAG TPA: tyrosine-type recombinase/integrase [Candidatus Paceibacterota bacterium]|nr:tyrosine-type recombinase/integrase [Verrucomicrobiota bacterium]HRZ47500.1 tyrosine-type recombinase/integrase [Candidatus Paceibacterota bacterium]